MKNTYSESNHSFSQVKKNSLDPLTLAYNLHLNFIRNYFRIYQKLLFKFTLKDCKGFC